MPLAPTLASPHAATAAVLLAAGAHWPVLAPTLGACIAIIAAILRAAARGKLHLPGYIGLAILAFVASVTFGKLSGAHGIAGSFVGVLLSVACFLSISAGVGSVLALAFYRDPPEPPPDPPAA
jgi:hypothetical protein